MIEDIKKNSNLIRILVILLIIAVGIYLANIIWIFLNNFSDIIIVLIFSWLLSFALEPVVDAIARYGRLPRIFAALATYLLLAIVISAIIYFYIPTVEFQIFRLVTIIPQKLQGAPSYVYKYGTTFTHFLDNAFTYIPSIAQFVFSTFIVLLISFYFVVDKENILKEFYSLTPNNWHKNMRFVQSVIENTFASFLRIQLLFGIMSGIATFIVLFVFGIDFAAFAAFLAGILTLIPMIGVFLALIPPVVAAFLVDPTKAIIVFVILLILQQIEFNVIGPRLMGNAFKLHPVIVLLSFLVGAKIAGGVGALFAVPVLGILVVIFREFGHYFINRNEK